MRAFLITSDKFTGTAEIVFNGDGVLCRIDATQTSMDADTIGHFKRAVPAHIDGLPKAFTAGTEVVETGFKITFEMWFKEYGYALDKKRAEKEWNRKDEAARVKAFFSVKPYNRFLQRKGGKQEKMYPKTYLNSEAYETDWDKVK